MLRIKVVAIAALLGLALSGMPGVANAVGGADPLPCADPSDCVLAISGAGEEPIVNAVRQLRLAGKDAEAAEFVAERREHVGNTDATVAAMEAIMEMPPEQLATSAETSDDDPPESHTTTTLYSWTYQDQWDFAYCGPDACGKPIGCVDAWITTRTVEFPTVSIDVQINGAGCLTRFQLTESSCNLIQEENILGFPVDTLVGQFEACPPLKSSSWQYVRQTFDWGTYVTVPNPKLADKFRTSFLFGIRIARDPNTIVYAPLESQNSSTFVASGPTLAQFKPSP